MNRSLTQQINEILGNATPDAELNCEARLLVAARTLVRAAPYEMTATTVVGVLGLDEQEAFCALAQQIADECALMATITVRLGSFSVRFERLASDSDEPATNA